MGESRPGLTTWGEVIGVRVSRSKDKIMVQALSRKRQRAQITGQNWERSVLGSIRAELGV